MLFGNINLLNTWLHATVLDNDEDDMTTSQIEARIRIAGKTVWQILKEAMGISLDLFRIMVPVLICVKALQMLGWIKYLALPLEPLMVVVGLPAEMGLVWATAMINNIYGAAVVFLTLAPGHSLSVAQVTVLSTLILVAHALPIEVKIAQKSGNRFWFQMVMRVGGALLLGFVLHWTYHLTGMLQQESVTFLKADISEDPGLLAWGVSQLRNLAYIFCIILALVILMRVLSWLRVTELLVRILQPVLRLLGIGREAAPLTIVGMTMGLTYGGGLIIRESKSGKVQPRDVFASITLMGLTHSLIEDTLLMVMLGGHLSGILFGRLLFSLLAVAILVRCVPLLSNAFVHRFLFRMAGQPTGGSGGFS